jgi:hypothetical protein
MNIESFGSPLFAMAVLFGYRQLNATLEAKTSKLKTLRKESDKAKIILLSLFHLVLDLIPLCTRGKEGVCRRRKFCDRRPVQHSIAPNRSGISV